MDLNLTIEPIDEEKLPLIIAGPCSAETEKQVLNTAKEIAKIPKVHYFRAGIWKPRTRPGSFEGVGTKGLEWLKLVKQETGLGVTTEVANAKHVDACLKAGIDVLWIGARTTVNPFTVQELAESLKGVDIPVLVKNPVNPDLQLWIGALERLNRAGIKKLAAIHRGFTPTEETPFRNQPMWSIPIELKVRVPDMPVICDPSHIAGNKDLVSYISQKAIDLDMDGLMVETHIQPDNALSDAKQQITPTVLAGLLKNLIIRKPISPDKDFMSQLDELRLNINKIDEEIIQKLSSRMEVVRKIGQYKKDHNVTILQLKRWADILENRSSLGEAMGLSSLFMKKLLQLVHQESIRIQEEVMNK